MKQTVKWLAAALIALGLNQAVWADDVSDFRENLQAAAQGNAEAQVNLGVAYVEGQGVRRRSSDLVKWFRQAAEQGNTDAQNILGLMYANGQGVRQDYVEAVRWFRQAAEQGNTLAQTLLGVMYENGRGVRQDLALAQEWFDKACQNGNPTGCYNYLRLTLGY